MRRVAIPLTGWLVERTGQVGGALSASVTNLNKARGLSSWDRGPRRLRFWLMDRRRGMRLLPTLASASVMAAAGLTPAIAADISGAGATFPYPIYAKWADAYKKETGVGLNYQSIGSGGGIKQIQNKTVTFGASDMPLALADLNKDELIQFPTVIGGDVPVVNLEGIQSGGLKLDGLTLARIFLGEIKTWNDAAI